MLPRPAARALVAAGLGLLAFPSCGGGAPAPQPSAPFVIEAAPPGALPSPGGSTPAPVPPPTVRWDPDAAPLHRTATFGSFPAGLAPFEGTLFVNDADAIEADGAWIRPYDTSGPGPTPSTRYQPFQLTVDLLVDAQGRAASLATPIGFGFFVNEVLVVDEHLGLVLVNAGATDAAGTLSNLVAFDPTTGALRQVVNLANRMELAAPLVDSRGNAAPGNRFVQSQAEALVVTSEPARRLVVAMANLLTGPPGFGTDRQRGTLQVYDLDPHAALPVKARPAAGLTTETWLTQDYNPVALALTETDPDLWGVPRERLLVTCGGCTAYDAAFRLLPVTEASVEVHDPALSTYLGRFRFGLAGLAGTPPALGSDAAGHRVGYFASSVTGEVYALWLDGLRDALPDPARLAVLRGPGAGLDVARAWAGGPGGNLAGLGLAPDGRTLVVSAFGDVFTGAPGRLVLLALPDDVLDGAGLGPQFVPGVTVFGTVSGRTLGPLWVRPGFGVRPDVLVAVGGPLDPTTFLGSGPASLGTLTAPGLLR